MNIAIVIEKFQPSAGGNERSTEQIARRLIEGGHAVTVLANTADPAAGLPAGGRVVTADGMSTKHAAGLRRFTRWAERELKRGGYDTSLSVSTATPAAVIQPRGGTVRETLQRNVAMRRNAAGRAVKRLALALSPKQRALLAAERRTLRERSGVKRIVAISRYVADQLVHHYGVSAERIASIANAAEVERFEPGQRDRVRQDERERLGWSEGDVVFLFAATNPRLKGLDALLRAFDRLRGGVPRARLLLAGFGDERVRGRVDRSGFGPAVRCVGPVEGMDRLYAAADVTVLPSWYDPASKVVLESLLHGVPAISTLHNGASQWIYDPSGAAAIPSPFEAAGRGGLIRGPAEQAGRVIGSPADDGALAEAMAALCDDTVRAACSAATEGLNQRIGMDRHVEQLERVLAEAAEDGHAGVGEPRPHDEHGAARG